MSDWILSGPRVEPGPRDIGVRMRAANHYEKNFSGSVESSGGEGRRGDPWFGKGSSVLIILPCRFRPGHKKTIARFQKGA